MNSSLEQARKAAGSNDGLAVIAAINNLGRLFGMTPANPLRRAATLLFKANDADSSAWRSAMICEAIRELEATGRRDLTPIIERLSEAASNVSDNDCLVSIEDYLRGLIRAPVMLERAA